METINKCSTNDHVIKLGNGKFIRVRETLPKEETYDRNNTIIIASGFARRMDHFAGLAEYLSSNGFHVIRYDSLYHVGLSSGSINEFTMSAGKESLLFVINWLNSRNITKFGLIASSLSARIAYEVAQDINLSFLVTAVGVVNLRDTLERAFKYDYLQLGIKDLPDELNFKGHKLDAEIFVTDCFNNNWETFESTKEKTKNLEIPMILFTANRDDWVKEDEVIELVNNIKSNKSMIYSLIGSSHDLSENLVVLRNFYQSVTRAAIALDNGSTVIDIEFIEPQFERLTAVTVNERRLKNKIEGESVSVV
ncbi:fatty acid reductase transferase subunit LuxD [Candidatus Enterovibrio escicola]|uniref:fatty acid reductase transferase subunit LuxD n=1 Tax=Candidatus Enterovibrio escicola TaxID=1927127 RepID=UPI001237F303|nr:acyl transferase [Candidatus Enterovibrio escacola]